MSRCHHKPKKQDCLGPLKLQQLFLWDDHFYLTRQLVVAATYDLPCLGVDLQALLSNQDNLGDNFGELICCWDKHVSKQCCDQASTQLKALLREHIDIAVLIVKAAIARDQEEVERLYALWVLNADQIACTYHTYHKQIDYCVMKEHMQMHLDTTLAEAVAIIGKDESCELSRTVGEAALVEVREMALYIDSTFPEKKCKSKDEW